jgi:hypothetical protein
MQNSTPHWSLTRNKGRHRYLPQKKKITFAAFIFDSPVQNQSQQAAAMPPRDEPPIFVQQSTGAS